MDPSGIVYISDSNDNPIRIIVASATKTLDSPLALSVTVRVTLKLETEVGVKVMQIGQPDPASSDAPQVLVWAKTPAFAPLMEILPTLSGAFPVFARVAICAALVAPLGAVEFSGRGRCERSHWSECEKIASRVLGNIFCRRRVSKREIPARTGLCPHPPLPNLNPPEVESMMKIVRCVLLALFAMSPTLYPCCLAETPAGSRTAPPMISQAIDNTRLVTLRGNVRRDLTAEQDLGPVDDSLQLRLFLVLQRSPEQQADLDNLIAR